MPKLRNLKRIDTSMRKKKITSEMFFDLALDTERQMRTQMSGVKNRWFAPKVAKSFKMQGDGRYSFQEYECMFFWTNDRIIRWETSKVPQSFRKSKQKCKRYCLEHGLVRSAMGQKIDLIVYAITTLVVENQRFCKFEVYSAPDEQLDFEFPYAKIDVLKTYINKNFNRMTPQLLYEIKHFIT